VVGGTAKLTSVVFLDGPAVAGARAKDHPSPSPSSACSPAAG